MDRRPRFVRREVSWPSRLRPEFRQKQGVVLRRRRAIAAGAPSLPPPEPRRRHHRAITAAPTAGCWSGDTARSPMIRRSKAAAMNAAGLRRRFRRGHGRRCPARAGRRPRIRQKQVLVLRRRRAIATGAPLFPPPEPRRRHNRAITAALLQPKGPGCCRACVVRVRGLDADSAEHLAGVLAGEAGGGERVGACASGAVAERTAVG